MAPRTKYIRDCARLLLKRHGINQVPTDLETLVKKEGLEYQEVDYFDDDVDALIITQGNRVIAVVNQKQHIHRRRFSLAHELCHHLHHQDRTLLDDRPTIDSDMSDTPGCARRKDVYEDEADIFAGELLIPLAILKLHCHKQIDEISAIFQVSPQAASIAISNHFTSLYK